MSGGQWMSVVPGQTTVMVKLHEFESPLESTAVHLTVVVPQGKRSFGDGKQLTVGFGSQLSLALGTGYGTCTGLQSGLLTVMPAGQVMDGGTVSMTNTWKQHWVR